MSVQHKPYTIRYRGETATAAAGEAVTARTQPHYMGMLIAGAVLYFIYPVEISIATLPIIGPDLYTALAFMAAIVLLPMSCFHFSTHADPAGRTITRRRHFLWIPLWSRTWSFADIQGYVIKRPGVPAPSLDTSGNIMRSRYRYNTYGESAFELFYMAATIVLTVIALVWDLVSPFKLYLVTDQGRYLVATGMHQGHIGNTGRNLGRMAGVKCH